MREEERLWWENFSEFGKWAENNESFLLLSHPRSGREWICDILRSLTRKESRSPGLVVPGTWSEYLFFLDHVQQKRAEDILMRFAARAKILLLVRDPRDAALSDSYRRVYYKQYPDVTEYSDELLDSAIDDICNYWCKRIEDFSPYETIMVQYEHFCINPIMQLERIIEFFGLNIERDIENAVLELDEISRIRKLQIPEAERDLERVPQVATFVDGWDRYAAHCLKWQKDENFRECHNRRIVLNSGEIMSSLGYHSRGHDVTYWAWKLENGREAILQA